MSTRSPLYRPQSLEELKAQEFSDVKREMEKAKVMGDLFTKPEGKASSSPALPEGKRWAPISKMTFPCASRNVVLESGTGRERRITGVCLESSFTLRVK